MNSVLLLKRSKIAFDPRFVTRRLQAATKRGDLRFIALWGYGPILPGNISTDEALDLIRHERFRLVRGARSPIRGSHHQQFTRQVEQFAALYNNLMRSSSDLQEKL